MRSLKWSFAAMALSFVFVAAAQEQAPEGNMTPKERADLEAQLKDARQRLEEAAREVGKLSGQLTGPVAYDYFFANPMGTMRGARLGVSIESDADRADAVTVVTVVPNGPAEKAGIKSGDLIVGVNGKTLRGGKSKPGETLVQYMEEVKPGEKVKVGILRGGKNQTVDVTAEAASTFGWSGNVEPLLKFQRERRLYGVPTPGVPAVPSHPLPTLPQQFFDVTPERGMVFGQFIGGDMLDMELVTVTPKLGRYFGTERGVLVVRPPRDSALKLEEGDVILDIDGRQPQSGVHAMRILRSYQPGEEVTFNVMRDRKTLKVVIEMPKSGTNMLENPFQRRFKVPTPPSREEST